MTTFHLGLIGYPLGHSRSPAIHEAAMAALTLTGDYQLYPVVPLPDGADALNDLLGRMRASEIHGLNVTIPHKQSVISLLDVLTPAAQAIGAVNTILYQDGRLVGENTDGPGFLADLKSLAPDLSTSSSEPHSALVFGAGGSAHAVVWALLNAGWRVTIAARRIEQAQELAIRYQFSVINETDSTIETQKLEDGHQLSAIQYERRALSNLITHHSFPMTLIVNCTSLGMSPAIDDSPWPNDIPFPQSATVYDLVYNPLETLLVRQARQSGLRAFTGLGMLVEQAALAFELWTGLPAPRDVMRKAVTQV